MRRMYVDMFAEQSHYVIITHVPHNIATNSWGIDFSCFKPHVRYKIQ